MARRRVRSWLLRWGGIAVTLLITLVYAANMPFYAGQGVGRHWNWRMEHGRLRVERSAQGSTENFYIAINSEGLRFRPDWRLYGGGNWYVNVPLWAPLGVALGATAWAWAARYVTRWRRRRTGECADCGYDLKGLAAGAACPECGEARNLPASS